MDFTEQQLKDFDLSALSNELSSRETQVKNLKESIQWAIKEHEDQIFYLKEAIRAKKAHG